MELSREVFEYAHENVSDEYAGHPVDVALMKEHKELKQMYSEAKNEIVTALNFMQSMGWQNYDPSEPEYQCQKSLSDFVLRMNAR